jgi:hypothetical protein
MVLGPGDERPLPDGPTGRAPTSLSLTYHATERPPGLAKRPLLTVRLVRAVETLRMTRGRQ